MQLQQIFDAADPATLLAQAEESVTKYLAALPSPGVRPPPYGVGESPLDFLERAMCAYATAIGSKVRDPAALHLRLAVLLEERFRAEDVMGLRRTDEVRLYEPRIKIIGISAFGQSGFVKIKIL